MPKKVKESKQGWNKKNPKMIGQGTMISPIYIFVEIGFVSLKIQM